MSFFSIRSLQRAALVSCSAAWVACAGDAGMDTRGSAAAGGMGGSSGDAGAARVMGGTGGFVAGSSGGGTGRAGRAGGGDSGKAGRAGGGDSGKAGAAGGPGSGAGKANAGASGRAAGTVRGGAGGGDAGGSDEATAGAGGAAASSNAGEFGITTCQPAFQSACNPKIEFVNGEPDGRGKVFTNVVPDVETTLKDIACVACSMLYRNQSEIPANKHPGTIKLILDTHGGVAQSGGGQIQFDLTYIDGYADKSQAETKQEMLGVLQHETVHLYQNYGNNGTGEGMADLVRTREGYYQRSHWRKGGSWKDAYTTSGFFYSWLTGPCAFHKETYSAHDLDLPYKLNKALADKQDDAAYTAVNDLLTQTFHRDADSLWQEYQDTAF